MGDKLSTGCQTPGLAPVLNSKNMLLSSKEIHTLCCHQRCSGATLQLFSLNKIALWHNVSFNFLLGKLEESHKLALYIHILLFHPFLKANCHISISFRSCGLTLNCIICAMAFLK